MIDTQELKSLILEAAEKAEPLNGLDGDEVLFGEGSRLDLDSIDALQISMAIQKRYGVRLNDSKETRRAMGSVNLLAAFLTQ
ncbi:MAG: phosphopantetheine-binding protein [Pseudomonadota bacterium]